MPEQLSPAATLLPATVSIDLTAYVEAALTASATEKRQSAGLIAKNRHFDSSRWARP